jgi:hypothetical protein
MAQGQKIAAGAPATWPPLLLSAVPDAWAALERGAQERKSGWPSCLILTAFLAASWLGTQSFSLDGTRWEVELDTKAWDARGDLTVVIRNARSRLELTMSLLDRNIWQVDRVGDQLTHERE